jgi:hypothetical protein
MGLARYLTVAAAGVLPWTAATTPATAASEPPQIANVEWEFSPANGTGARCTLRASGLVNTYEDGRVAIGRFTLLDDDPACRPARVSVVLDYTDSLGQRRRSTAFAQGATTDLSAVGDHAASDAKAVVDVGISYDGCDETSGCFTSRVVHPK